jgi:preprotein translocase subunit SecE
LSSLPHPYLASRGKVTEAKKQAAKKQRKSRFAFITNIVTELRKVAWPTRRQTIYLTVIVLTISVAVGIVLWGLDYGFAELIKALLKL